MNPEEFDKILDKTTPTNYLIYKINCICGKYYYGITNKLSQRKFGHKKACFNKTKKRYWSPIYCHIRSCVKNKEEFQYKIKFEIIEENLHKQQAIFNEYYLIKYNYGDDCINCMPNIDKLIKNKFNIFF